MVSLAIELGEEVVIDNIFIQVKGGLKNEV
jgi:hypothetical protein